MKALLTTLLAVSTVSMAYGEETYRLPFKGLWFVLQGGDSLDVNHHMGIPSEWYGVDFMKAGGDEKEQGSKEKETTGKEKEPASKEKESGKEKNRDLENGKGTTVKSFFCWDTPVLSPVDGEVVRIVDEYPDNAVGIRDDEHPDGNCVVLKSPAGRYVFLTHLKKDSILAKAGNHVLAGDELGRCGNSGNCDHPLLHMRVQDSPNAGQGRGLNMTFLNINVTLNGKKFDGVNWPLIRGLYVTNP
jgi:hypothetical protein